MKFIFKEVTTDSEKSFLCASVIATLPEWFGISQANQDYIQNIQNYQVFGVFDQDNQPIGGLALKYQFKGCAEIWWMGLSPVYHRQGLGQKLFESAKAAALGEGCATMVVSTLSARSDDVYYAKTRLFYESLGFSPLLEFNEADPHNPMMWMILSCA